MNLPFSPSFFRRLEVYQELKEFEAEGKLTWGYEKKFLQYAVMAKGLPIGMPIRSRTFASIIFKNSTTDERVTEPFDIPRSLEARGFGEMTGGFGLLYNIRLNT